MRNIPHFKPNIFIYTPSVNLVVTLLQRRLSRMNIDFTIELENRDSSLHQPNPRLKAIV